jgi:hypothetical protein
MGLCVIIIIIIIIIIIVTSIYYFHLPVRHHSLELPTLCQCAYISQKWPLELYRQEVALGWGNSTQTRPICCDSSTSPRVEGVLVDYRGVVLLPVYIYVCVEIIYLLFKALLFEIDICEGCLCKGRERKYTITHTYITLKYTSMA